MTVVLIGLLFVIAALFVAVVVLAELVKALKALVGSVHVTAAEHRRFVASAAVLIALVALAGYGVRLYLSARSAEAMNRFYSRAQHQIEVDRTARAHAPHTPAPPRQADVSPRYTVASSLDDILVTLPASPECPDDQARFKEGAALAGMSRAERYRALLSQIPDSVACAEDSSTADDRVGAAEDAAGSYGEAAELAEGLGNRANAHRLYGISVWVYAAAIHEAADQTSPATETARSMLTASQRGFSRTR